MFPEIGVPPNHPILIGFSIINHPFWGTPIFGNPQIYHFEVGKVVSGVYLVLTVSIEQWKGNPIGIRD